MTDNLRVYKHPTKSKCVIYEKYNRQVYIDPTSSSSGDVQELHEWAIEVLDELATKEVPSNEVKHKFKLWS